MALDLEEGWWWLSVNCCEDGEAVEWFTGTRALLFIPTERVQSKMRITNWNWLIRCWANHFCHFLFYTFIIVLPLCYLPYYFIDWNMGTYNCPRRGPEILLCNPHPNLVRLSVLGETLGFWCLLRIKCFHHSALSGISCYRAAQNAWNWPTLITYFELKSTLDDNNKYISMHTSRIKNKLVCLKANWWIK